MKKKEIIENVAKDIGALVYVGLRKWIDDPFSGKAWNAIGKIDAEKWNDMLKTVAEYMYPEMRKAFFSQFKNIK